MTERRLPAPGLGHKRSLRSDVNVLYLNLGQCFHRHIHMSKLLKCTLYFLFRFTLFNIFYWLCYYSCPIFFLPFIPLHPELPLPPASPHFSSCPWVIHVSSLASPFPILLLTSPCLFCTYHLCFLLPLPFPPFSLLPLPTDNPPCGLHFCDSVHVLVVCFCF